MISVTNMCMQILKLLKMMRWLTWMQEKSEERVKGIECEDRAACTLSLLEENLWKSSWNSLKINSFHDSPS